MPSQNPYPPRSKIECVGPECHVIASMITADRERWKSITKRQYPKKDQPLYLGWCPRCSSKFGVE